MTQKLTNDTILNAISDYFELDDFEYIKYDSMFTLESYKERIRKINKTPDLEKNKKLKISGNKLEIINRLNEFYKKELIEKKNEIINKYGNIEDWDLSEITIMNPEIRKAYELNKNFKKARNKVPIIKDILKENKKSKKKL